MKTNTFSKEERLCSRKQMDILFERGSSVQQFPLRLVYIEAPSNQKSLAIVAFSVPKKRIKKAHDRNRIKRLLKESYRLYKNEFYKTLESLDKKFVLMFVYSGNTDFEFNDAEQKIKTLLLRLTTTSKKNVE